MNNKQLKAKIFEIYSQNLNWVREVYNTKFYKEFEYGVFCPLCMDIFTKENIESCENANFLSLEHNPPEYFSGKSQLLTCKNCNNTLGHKLDSSLVKFFEENSIRQFLPNSKLNTKIETDLGAKVTSYFKIDENGKFNLEISKNYSSPFEYDLFKNSIKTGVFSMDEKSRFETKRLNFTLTLPDSTNKQTASVAALKIAYFYAFEKLGHLFLFNHNLDIVRKQINNPHSEIIKNYSFNMQMNRSKIGNLSLIKFSDNLTCYLISLDLKGKSYSRQFNILLPGFYETEKDIYQEYRNFVNSNLGKKFSPGIINLDNLVNLKNKRDTFLAKSIWDEQKNYD